MERLQVPMANTRSANSTLKRNFQSFPAFNTSATTTDDYNNVSQMPTTVQTGNNGAGSNNSNVLFVESSPKFNNQIQIVLQSPGNNSYRNILSTNKSSQSSLVNGESIAIKSIDGIEGEEQAGNNLQNSSQSNVAASTNNQLKNDDIEIMKQRSANNNTFICIKIPEIQLLVSYRATNKDKNIKDLKNVSFIFPLFEVHDKTWTWLDLVNSLKSHVKKALVRIAFISLVLFGIKSL